MTCGRRVLLSVVVLGTVAAVISPVLAAADSLSSAGSEALVRSAPAIASSAAGAILSADRMSVGSAATGSVRVANLSSYPARLTLTSSVEGSSRLARSLRVTLHRHSAGRSPEKVYDGPLVRIRSLPLGIFAAAGQLGSSYRFVFRAVLISAGQQATEQELQGLAARVRFSWTATQA